MDYSIFTVYYDGILWIGCIEMSCDASVLAARHIFGAEPGGAEIYEFVRKVYPGLFFCEIEPGHQIAQPGHGGFKKRLRKTAREQQRGTTRSQETLNRMRDQQRSSSKDRQHRRKDERRREIYEKRRQRKKRKARGH